MRDVTTDKNVIESIVRRATVCRIAMYDAGQPYIVPVSFGYRDGALYFHSSARGKKIDVLRKNNAVCVEFDVDHEVTKAEHPCQWGVRYRSVIGFGRAFFVEDEEEKAQALDAIVAHYGGEPQDYPPTTLEKTTVVRIEIQGATAKISGY
jgi:nitroimidazol reductase NimA-like FMN-containing flavoprotein (pyridoxamine 5'-phosphate oxidase superfamily)